MWAGMGWGGVEDLFERAAVAEGADGSLGID